MFPAELGDGGDGVGAVLRHSAAGEFIHCTWSPASIVVVGDVAWNIMLCNVVVEDSTWDHYGKRAYCANEVKNKASQTVELRVSRLNEKATF